MWKWHSTNDRIQGAGSLLNQEECCDIPEMISRVEQLGRSNSFKIERLSPITCLHTRAVTKIPFERLLTFQVSKFNDSLHRVKYVY
jgi:hypothetical protein